MAKYLFETQGIPTLSIVECQGDLIVRGWSKPSVRLQGDLETSQEGETIMVTSKSDLRVDVPYRSTLQVQMVQGDAVIKRVQDSLSLQHVQGDLVLSRVGPVSLGQVQGDLSARVVEGDLIVQAVQGDMSVRSVAGRLEVEHVGRDLGIRELAGGAHATNVQGDIRLRIAFAPGAEYTFKAGGDIVARVPANTNADLTLRSGRGKPRVKAHLDDVTESEHEVVGRLGDGGAAVVMEASRDLVLTVKEGERVSDWSDLEVEMGVLGAELGLEFAGLAEEIAAQIETQMSEMGSQLEEKLASVAQLDVRTAHAAERAQRQAEKAAERIRSLAEREAEKARRQAAKARRRAVHKARTTHVRSAEPEPVSEPISDDERLTILNMVAKGKISVEEAETLLGALRG